MKKLTLIFLVYLIFGFMNFAFSQSPLVKRWDKCFGGSGEEWLSSFQQTSDGGYILGGRSFSGISGNKTQANWNASGNTCDYWIVKTDSLGNKLWDKTFGGTGYDFLNSIQQTSDGGYILAGYSNSGISGDKTQSTWGGPADADYWIVKTDSLGNKQWDKDFGGTNGEQLFSIRQTSDGGYILGGVSGSGISGDKTQANWDPSGGTNDYWIVKTDSLGNKQWDKRFGGMQNEWLSSILQTTDGGFIFGGHSWSQISGDKTETNWGGWDYWIVKTDLSGNKQWERDFGGSDNESLSSIQQTSDGGFLFGGLSESGISGNKSQPNWDPSGTTKDYWIIKTDSAGDKQWEKDVGGVLTEDEAGSIANTADAGLLIAGTSYSPIGGNKTESNLGFEQTWVVKINTYGFMLWDKTIFTSGHDEQGLAIESSDGCVVIANTTGSGIAGYKTEPSWGDKDYWFLKFCDTTQLPIIAISGAAEICPGTCVDFLNLTVYSTSYQWSFPGGFPDTSTAANPTGICYPNPGSFDVQLIAYNSNGSDTVELRNYITVFPIPPPQGISQNGDTLFAVAGAPFYQWYSNGNLITGATNYFYIAPQSGDYNVVVTDTNGCEVEAVINDVIAVVTPLSFGEGSMVKLYPNPVDKELIIKNEELIIETAIIISIYNLHGALAFQLPAQMTPWTEMSVDVSVLTKGIYWLEITAGEKIYRAKFFKQ